MSELGPKHRTRTGNLMVALSDKHHANGTKQKLRLLLVDDDQEDAVLFERYVAQIKGFDTEVHWTNDYRDALHLMREQEFDICFIDFRLGRDSGMELISHALEHDAERAMVLVTGFGDENVAAECMRRGAVDYLSKSDLGPAALLRCIRVCLGTRKSRLRSSSNVYDELPGVYRLETFLGAARKEIDAEKETFGLQSVLVIDVDNLTQMIERHGKEIRQQVLRAVSATARGCLRRADMVGRFGPDQLCVLTHTSDNWMAEQLAEYIRAAVEHHTEATVSVGVAHAPNRSASVNSLLANAKAASIKARLGGGNRVEVVHS